MIPNGYAGGVKRLGIIVGLLVLVAVGLLTLTPTPILSQSSGSGGTITGKGTITPGDCVSWASGTQIQDTGSACGGGTGTVTSIGVATANGVSGTSSGGATPSLTITLGAITPTTVNGLTITTSTGTLTIPNGVTLTGPASSGTALISGGPLGTPSSGTLTNASGLPIGGIAAVAANTVDSNSTGSAASPTAVTALVLGLPNSTAGSMQLNSATSATTGLKLTDATGITTLGTNENLLIEPNGTGAIVVNVGGTASPTIQATGAASNTGLSLSAAVGCWDATGTFVACGTANGMIIGDGSEFGVSQTAQGNGTPSITLLAAGTSTTEYWKASTPVILPQCKIAAPVTLSTATTICTWTLPNAATTFSYQCQGTYSTSAASITLLLGTQFAQAPSAGANNAIIWSAASAQTFGTATNTGTTAVPTMTGAAVSSGTNIPWQASGTFTSSATSGTFVIYGTASTATDVTIATGSSCNLF